MKPQSVTKLLLRDHIDNRWEGIDRGVHWVANAFVLARPEVFTRPPKITRERNLGPQVRRILDRLRANPERGTGTDSLARSVDWGDTPVALVRCGKFYIPVNEQCYLAWKATGLDCRIAHDGTLLWYGTVRGKRALFGIVMPTYIGAEKFWVSP